ncbi:MAG: hypothetical protein JZU65_12060, partial [Chlorobium sp.]|nr:hypothetical protein [Chlorobium sp.]
CSNSDNYPLTCAPYPTFRLLSHECYLERRRTVVDVGRSYGTLCVKVRCRMLCVIEGFRELHPGFPVCVLAGKYVIDTGDDCAYEMRQVVLVSQVKKTCSDYT